MNTPSWETAGGSTLDAYAFVDGFARTVQARREAEDSTKEIVINTFYDPLDRPARQSIPHLASKASNYSSPDLTVLNVSTIYDPLGRVLSVRNTDGTYRNMTYNHWVNNITDENGHVKVFHYDAFQQIIAVEEHNGVEIYNTTYKYDTLGNLLNITDNLNNTFRFEYDTLGRKTGLRDPDLGNWTYGYDTVGNIINQTDARNITVRLTYDNLNRLLKMSYLNDTNVSYAYDVNLNGTLTQVNDSTGSVYYYYDSRLRKTRESRTIGGVVYNTSWSYDSMDRVMNMTYPSGERVDYDYNTQGQVQSVYGLVKEFTYNAFDKITSKAVANGVVTNYTYRTDNFRLERISTVNSSGGSYMNSSYTYDGVGNIMSIRDNIMNYNRTFAYDGLDRLTAANSTTGYQHTYAYNSIGNMLQWNDSGHTVNYSYGNNAGPHALTAYTTSGSYSCSGSQPPASGDWNITQATSCTNSQIVLGNGGNLVFTSYPLTLTNSQVYINGSMILNNNLILSNSSIRYYGVPAASISGGNITLTYDRNGNLVQDSQFYYEYNNANQLFRVRQGSSGGTILEEYAYDAGGQRAIKKTYGTVNTTVYYIGGHYEVTQYSNGTTVNTSYYFANNERIAQKNNNGVMYYHSDHLGSSTVMTNSSGNKIDEIRYLPYGEIESGGSSTKYGYNSKELDFTTGLNYYGARYYNPTTMHWTQPDTIIQSPYDPQNLNRYSYTRNNPLKYTDPSGNILFIPFVVAVGLGVAAMAYYAQTHGSEGNIYDMLKYGAVGAVAPLVATAGSIVTAGLGAGSTISAMAGGVISGVFQGGSESIIDDTEYTTSNLVTDAGGGLLSGFSSAALDKLTRVFRPSTLKQGSYFLQHLGSNTQISENSIKLLLSDLTSEMIEMMSEEELEALIAKRLQELYKNDQAATPADTSSTTTPDTSNSESTTTSSTTNSQSDQASTTSQQSTSRFNQKYPWLPKD